MKKERDTVAHDREVFRCCNSIQQVLVVFLGGLQKAQRFRMHKKMRGDRNLTFRENKAEKKQVKKNINPSFRRPMSIGLMTDRGT